MPQWLARLLPAALILAGLLLIGAYFSQQGFVAGRPAPTKTPEPIIPTRTPAQEGSLAPQNGASEDAHSAAVISAEAINTAEFGSPDASLYLAERERFGVAAPTHLSHFITPAYEAGLRFGIWHKWTIDPAPPQLGQSEFWQMVRVEETELWPGWEALAAAVEARPGAIWLIGNEPDVIWQDNLTPQRYAEMYHDIYEFIKARDATARVAIGGVSQPTPLRRAYLDAALAHYQERYGQPMPVDIFNVHAFILNEEAGSWGVDIPPGMDGAGATRYSIDDHDDMAIFRQNLIEFRAWMAARGYRDRPLVVSEYGILHPADYGFPPQAVAAFMQQSFEFFLTARNETGYPADDNRLVQWWVWYSVYDDPDRYPTGNLFDPATGELTSLGQLITDYADR